MGNSLDSRILVLGLDNSGKSTFVKRFLNPKQVPVAEPTEAFTTEFIKFGGIKWNVWDVSGKKNVRSLWPKYYNEGGVDAILWVVDSTGTDEQMEESRKELESQLRHPQLNGKAVYILYNKQDLKEAKKPEDLKTFFRSPTLIEREKTSKVFHRGVSAKTGLNVKESMVELAKELKVELKAHKS